MIPPEDFVRRHGRGGRRTVAAIIALLFCLCGALVVGRMGMAEFYADYGRRNNSLKEMNEAVGLDPRDPDMRFSRAKLLDDLGLPDEAVNELERAVALRPDDYRLWLELGHRLDQVNDQQGALKAYRRAILCAPYYAEPRWQLGNLLLRTGSRDEAFAELRQAAIDDPTLQLGVIDLARNAYGGDWQAIKSIIQPSTPAASVALARLLIEHHQTIDGIAILEAAGGMSDQDWRAMIGELVEAKRFDEAHQVWAGWRKISSHEIPTDDQVFTDGGFERRITINDPGFGWQVEASLQAATISQDTVEPHRGARSLLLDFNGGSDSQTTLVSQIILVKPKRDYQLTFAARTRNLVTGGLPLISITDVSNHEERRIAQSQPLQQGTNGWREMTFAFSTGEQTKAVRVSLQRQECANTPCPIFGQVWLDDFSTVTLSNATSISLSERMFAASS